MASGALESEDEAAEVASRPVEVDTPPLGTKVSKDDAVRDLADELEPGRDSLDLGRVSSMPLRDSDLQFVAESRDSGGFVSALGKDPDADDPELSRFNGSLTRPRASLDKPKEPEPRMPLPSVVLSPQLSTRNDSTERISTRPPRTPPITHSLSPAERPKSVAPSDRRGGLWMGLAAAALVLGGVGFASLRGGQSAEQTIVATSQPKVAEVIETVREVQPPRKPVVEPKVEAAPVAEVPAAPKSDRELAREEARAERRRAREAARAAQTEAGEAVEGAPKVVKAAEGAAKPLNDQPTRDEVVAAMTAIAPRLKECVGDKHGLADVTITVRSAGHVSYSIVAGSFVGTEEGSCIARVVKEARFPEFTEPFVRITYPFQL